MTSNANKEMTLYFADYRGNAKNTGYPHALTIKTADDLAQVAQFDNVSADYNDATTKTGNRVCRHRAKKDFLSADNINMDCDNDEHNPLLPDLPPEQWKRPDDIQAAFPDVCFYAVPSRNNMKEKNGKPARPKYHYYFPLRDTVTDFQKWTDLKTDVQAYFPAFDEKALDAAHFLFGIENATAEYYPGEHCIDEFMQAQAAAQKAARAKQNKDRPKFGEPIQIGNRHGTLLSFANIVLKKYGICDKAHDLFMQRVAQCEQPKPDDEIKAIWRDACKFYTDTVSTAPGYMDPNEYAAQEFEDDLEPTDYTDVGQANIFVSAYGDIVRYSAATEFLVYDGQKWVENELEAQALSQLLTERQLKNARQRLIQAQQEYNAAVESGDKDAEKAAKANLASQEKWHKFVLSRRKSDKIKATLTEVRPKVQIAVSELDKNPYLLNTPDGTVDLRTGEMKPHDPNDYCTKMTAVSPSTDNMQMWLDFVDRVTSGDKGLAEYNQLCAGMGLIGEVKIENLQLAHGGGGNGKSTYYNAQYLVLGDYAGMLSAETLTVNCRKNKSPEFAELRGKRLIIAAELEEGMRLDTAVVKKLCSTDPIKAEKKFKAPFDFIPSHTTVLYTNHLPKVGTNDQGTWDRLVVIPFNAKFRGMKGEIKNYAQYLFEHCGGAVLQWCIDGARKLIAQNFIIKQPQAVQDAIEEYRSENDWFNNFLTDCCEIGADYVQKSGPLYEEYRTFCSRVGDYCRSLADFKATLTAAGFKTHKKRDGAYVFGLRLTPAKFEKLDGPSPFDGYQAG